MDNPDEILRSVDPGIHAMVAGAGRGDRSVLPALRNYLEQALALFTDSDGSGGQAAAAMAGKPEKEAAAAFQRLMAPMTLFTELLAAAWQLPDPSLAPVLRALAEHMPDNRVLDALERTEALTQPANAGAGGSAPGTIASEGKIVRLLREDNYRALQTTIRKAPVPELLDGIVECIATENSYKHDIAAACHRRPESDILSAVQSWAGHAGPRRREAAAWALGREGEDDVPADPRVLGLLHGLLTDREPEVVVAALHGLAQRTARNYTPDDLNRMRQACEHHPSVKVRQAYSDAFYSPYVGGDPAPGALDTWCRLTKDEDPRQRSLACGRLAVFLYGDKRDPRIDYRRISTVLNAARMDSSANVRFTALAALLQLGEDHTKQIQAELENLARLLERSGVTENTIDEDNGLNMVNEIVIKPSRKYVPALERIMKALPIEEGSDFWLGLVESCRKAPRWG